MGFLDEFTNKSNVSKPNVNLPQRKEPSAPKPDLVKGSWLKGGEAEMYDVNKYFRNPKVRDDLYKRFKISKSQPDKLDAEIKSMMKMVPNKYRTGVIEPEELKSRSFEYEKYWGLKHDIDKKREGGLTKEELKDFNRHKEKIKYIEEKFGK